MLARGRRVTFSISSFDACQLVNGSYTFVNYFSLFSLAPAQNISFFWVAQLFVFHRFVLFLRCSIFFCIFSLLFNWMCHTIQSMYVVRIVYIYLPVHRVHRNSYSWTWFPSISPAFRCTYACESDDRNDSVKPNGITVGNVHKILHSEMQQCQ